jgi:hypothetical protein
VEGGTGARVNWRGCRVFGVGGASGAGADCCRAVFSVEVAAGVRTDEGSCGAGVDAAPEGLPDAESDAAANAISKRI